ncbi:Transmembrane protein 116 [Merluccius polli]|uniref:Transmembrane protein 116 n=1 Tax=Merluccius polli TaxID=89951 RepID=A0AA47N0K1_MERPO|nr:Transmembrane protein 116 [Merluccius polli]
MDAMIANSTQRNTSNAENLTDVYEALRWVQLAMAVLSIIGSGSIVMFAASQKLFQSQEVTYSLYCQTLTLWTVVITGEVHPLLLLSGSDLLLALSWLVGAALFTQDPDTHTTCYHLHTVEQFLYMTSFFYTLYYVWSLYSGLRSRLYCSINGLMTEEASKVVSPRIIAVVAGVLPLLLMSPVLIQGNLGRCYANFSQPYRCLLMQTGALYPRPEHGGERRDCQLLHAYRDTIFLLTFLFTLTGIMVLMEQARRVHRRVVTSGGFLGDRQWATLRVVDRRMLLYPSVFIFCWAPALCVAVLNWLHPTALQGIVGVVFYITQAFTSGSQGFLNSLAYGWTHSRFRDARRSRTVLRDAHTQTPLLRSQRQGYRTLGDERAGPHKAPGTSCSHT